MGYRDSEHHMKKVKTHVRKLPIRNINKKHILEFTDELAAEGISRVRQQKYMYVLGSLSKMIGERDWAKLTKDEIKHLCAEINRSDLAEWTKHDRMVAIKRFMKYLYEQKGETYDRGEYPDAVKWIRTSMRNNRMKKPTDLLKFDEVKKIAEHTNNLRDRSMVMVLFESGARVGELQNIKVKHVVFDQHGALLDLFGKTGQRRVRLISSSPSISNWLLDHPEKNDPKFHDSYLFASLWGKNRGGFISYPQINLLLREAAQKAGITKPVRPHWFRHSRATQLAKKLPEAVLCEFFGWVKGSQVVGTYTHLSAKNIDNAILKLHGIETDEEKDTSMNPITCPRCTTINDPSSKFCSQCSLGLDEKSVIEYDTQKELAAKTGFEYLKSGETTQDAINQALLSELKSLRKELEEVKQNRE